MNEITPFVAASPSPPIVYTPQDWFWFIEPDIATNVYSSKRCTLVPAATDQEYIDWCAVGYSAPTLDSMTTLEAMMAVQFPAGTLKSYNPDARYRKASGGCTIAGKPYLTDPVSRNTLASAHDYAVVNPGHITDWKLADGTFIQLDEPGLAHALQEMATFVQACFSCESANLTAITGGTMTTVAEIDAAFAAISNVLA